MWIFTIITLYILSLFGVILLGYFMAEKYNKTLSYYFVLIAHGIVPLYNTVLCIGLLMHLIEDEEYGQKKD